MSAGLRELAEAVDGALGLPRTFVDVADGVEALQAREALLEAALEMALDRLLLVQRRELGVDCTAEIEAARAVLGTRT